LNKVHLVLVIHSHQPVGNFDAILEKIYQQSYLPFLQHLSRHPGVRMGLHYTGPLLEWLDARHPEFMDELGKLAARGQVEIIGGGFYEPIMISIPSRDQAAQFKRMSDYIMRRFGSAPSGAWLAERVWEPQLPAAFEAAKINYTLLDDVHFQAAGIELEDLFGYYIAEDRGAKVNVIPGLKTLRYLVPFRGVDEILAYLRGVAERHPDGMAAMGDDNEKFGAWPGTYNHCYRDGWLEKFFSALEENADWLVTTPPGQYLAQHPPLGRAALPTASYTELMEWVLPTPARNELAKVGTEFGGRPEVMRFVRGGIWRGFLCKYPEANLLHKKMLRVSRKIGNVRAGALGRAAAGKLEHAKTHLLRAQCNDAYWHGVFGGVYAPHLRTELWRELIRAECIVESLGAARAQGVHGERFDFDADGADEIYLTSPKFAALLKPDDGASMAALDFRPESVALINSLQRRPETYHARVAEAVHGESEGVASIHDQIRSKESGLADRLRYDRWAKNAFRLLLFPNGKKYSDYDAIRLEESAAFAAGVYVAKKSTGGEVAFELKAPLEIASGYVGPSLKVKKEFSFTPTDAGFRIRCRLELKDLGHAPRSLLEFQAGLEIVINLLAPNAADRYFEVGAHEGPSRHPLNWGGESAAPVIRAVDEWQNVAVRIDAPGAAKFWTVPIDTVSESEEGFERVYQGSQIMAVWPVKFETGGEWSAEIFVDVTSAKA
jgi:4-alpha-glucanotransferase